MNQRFKLRERILSVYRGETPDAVPYMLDLSHWFYHKNKLPWDLSKVYDEPEYELINYHKKMGVGFYMPNLGAFYETRYPEEVRAETRKSDDGRAVIWTLETPLGRISRSRVWEDATYAWAISDWAIKTEDELKVLGYASANRSFRFLPEKYRAWMDYVGDMGVCYLVSGLSGMGQIMNYWMGVERMAYACADWPDTMHKVIDQRNDNNLNLMDVLAESPAEIIIVNDNFSGDIHPPAFYDEWAKPYYDEAIRRLHKGGKFVAAHVNGRLAGALGMMRDSGADCADAVTPTPMGDLTAQQCRDEAGDEFILSGGVSPDLWLPDTPVEAFEKGVLDWLELKKRGPRLIAAAGDQVPPYAVEERIEIMRDLVEEQGQY